MSLIAEVVFSGFVSKAVNNCVDISWDKIKKAVKDKNNKHQSLESQIYNVIVDVLNKITDNPHKDNQSIIYEAAESVLKLFKESSVVELENIKSCLNNPFLFVDEKKCMDFKILLYEELGKNEYSELFHTILLLLLDQKNQYDREVVKQLIQKLDQVILILNQKEDGYKSNNTSNAPQTVKSRTQEYADKWDANMFLNNFDKRDENAGVNVKLCEVYLEFHLPNYLWQWNSKPSNDLKILLSEYIDRSNENDENKMLLVLGQPGIGKSTLITWIAANFKEIAGNILVYQFAFDLKNIKLNNDSINDGIGKKVIEELNLQYEDLNNKILILDGFDEINIESGREDFINQIYSELIKKKVLCNFTLIITCRENYIHDMYKVECQYIILQSWNKEQMQSFCNIYGEKVGQRVSNNMMDKLNQNEKIFGIPLILYMILALNISFEKDDSIVDVYDHIFALEGGIYDRCIKGKRFGDKHRISTIKRQLHEISKEIAFWMFENEAEKASIPQKEYIKICEIIINRYRNINKNIKQDFMIGNFFKLKHTEGNKEELYFVHRSIYEYFVADNIYKSIENDMENLSKKNQTKLGENIVFYLKKGRLEKTISEYLQYKLIKKFNQLDVSKKKRFYEWWENIIVEIMDNGMLIYSNYNMFEKYRIKDFIYMEVFCFLNLIELLRLLLITSKRKYILQNANISILEIYLKYCSLMEDLYFDSLGSLDFTIMYLSKVKIPGINLKVANLRGADLRYADLERADLYGADLCDANLKGANLKGANLEKANLCRAYLNGANLYGAYINESNWLEEDIERVLPLLRNVNFQFIYLNKEKISKEEILLRK